MDRVSPAQDSDEEALDDELADPNWKPGGKNHMLLIFAHDSRTLAGHVKEYLSEGFEEGLAIFTPTLPDDQALEEKDLKELRDEVKASSVVIVFYSEEFMRLVEQPMECSRAGALYRYSCMYHGVDLILKVVCPDLSAAHTQDVGTKKCFNLSGSPDSGTCILSKHMLVTQALNHKGLRAKNATPLPPRKQEQQSLAQKLAVCKKTTKADDGKSAFALNTVTKKPIAKMQMGKPGVAIRLRPFNQRELEMGCKPVIEIPSIEAAEADGGGKLICRPQGKAGTETNLKRGTKEYQCVRCAQSARL